MTRDDGYSTNIRCIIRTMPGFTGQLRLKAKLNMFRTYFLEFGLAEGEEGWRPGACMVYAYRKDISTEP